LRVDSSDVEITDLFENAVTTLSERDHIDSETAEELVEDVESSAGSGVDALAEALEKQINKRK
jgi:ribosome-associated translation inhibitor RaiA